MNNYLCVPINSLYTYTLLFGSFLILVDFSFYELFTYYLKIAYIIHK